MNKFLQELKRRNVIKASLAYLVISWIIVQVAQAVLPTFGAPDWVLKALIIGLAIGLPIWIIISWIYDITPEGVEKTAKVSENDLVTEITNKRLNIFIIVSLSIAVIVMGLKLSNVFSDSDKQYSIAVLPFDDMSQENDNIWFCDGVTESILTKLSKIKSLTVISRTSVKQYRDHKKTIPEIAKELGVNFILEGSVRKQNNNVLITAQLINANDKHVWADDYDGVLDDIFAIQQVVAEEIANQLKISLSPEEKSAIEKDPTNNKRAYDLYVEGLYLADKHTPESLKRSVELFQQAIDLDPNFADAYAEMASSNFLYRQYIDEYKNGDEYIENINNVRKQADKALQINPDLAKPNLVKGMVLYWLNDGRDKEKAKKYFEKADSLNQNDPKVHFILSHYYNELIPKDNIKILYHSNMAAKLDPLSIETNYWKILFLLRNNKIDEAETHYEKKAQIFEEGDRRVLKNNIIRYKGERLSIQNKDWTETVRFYKEEVKKDPNNAYLNRKLGEAYDGILNDDINFIKYTKRAYELDSAEYNLNPYRDALFEGGKFIEAKKLMGTDNYLNIRYKKDKLEDLFYYYYYQEDYKKAQEILRDSIMLKNNYLQLLNFAQLGERERVDEISKKEIWNTGKAFVYAILMEKDSMYHYLSKDDIYFKHVNSRKEFDPYRKEERYKTFLKKNYLPITHWNE